MMKFLYHECKLWNNPFFVCQPNIVYVLFSRTYLMPRQQIKDEYEIVTEIGAGGMATVYRAIQKSLDRLVAIKELKKAYHGDEQIVRRFEREGKVAASLQ